MVHVDLGAEAFNIVSKHARKSAFFFALDQKCPVLAKFGRACQHCQFKLKIGILANASMHNLMVVFTFSVFDRKYSFSLI